MIEYIHLLVWPFTKCCTVFPTQMAPTSGLAHGLRSTPNLNPTRRASEQSRANSDCTSTKCYKCHCLFQFVDPHKHKQLHCLTYKLHFLPQLPRVLTSHDWYSPCRPLGRQPVLAEIWGAYFSIVLFVVHANYRVHKVGKSGLIKMSWYYWQDKDTVWKDQVKTRSSLKVVFFIKFQFTRNI